MHYYEKLLILIVLFVGMTMGTAGIIGIYAKTAEMQKAGNNRVNNNNSIVLD